MSSSFPAARFPALPLSSEKAAEDPIYKDTVAEASVPSDDALIAGICSGDSEALGILFHRYARLVWIIGKRILQNTEEADDLLQDVFLLVHRRASVFDPSKGTVRSLLVQMCYQRAFSRRRDLMRRNFYCANEDSENAVAAHRSFAAPVYDEGLEARFGRAKLKKAFEELSGEQRETLRLCFFEGYTLEEIAEQTGASYGNVRHHYYRGLKKLRQCAREA